MRFAPTLLAACLAACGFTGLDDSYSPPASCDYRGSGLLCVGYDADADRTTSPHFIEYLHQVTADCMRERYGMISPPVPLVRMVSDTTMPPPQDGSYNHISQQITLRVWFRMPHETIHHTLEANGYSRERNHNHEHEAFQACDPYHQR